LLPFKKEKLRSIKLGLNLRHILGIYHFCRIYEYDN
jgi:hypothetical protein